MIFIHLLLLFSIIPVRMLASVGLDAAGWTVEQFVRPRDMTSYTIKLLKPAETAMY